MSRSKMWATAAFSLCCVVAVAAPPKNEPGRAGKVVDGDTLVFVPADGTPERLVRIDGIDAPELCQPWGLQSRDALIELVRGKDLVLQAKGGGKDSPALARIFVAEVDVGDRLVRDGHAWSLRYRSDRGPYVNGERIAVALKRGLHSESGAQRPRDFVKTRGPCPA